MSVVETKAEDRLESLTEKLPRAKKVLYGVGDLGFSLTSTILGAYFAIFLTDVVGISAGIAAIAIFVGRSWDYINDPIIGHLSDRTRSRWGRRRPFLLFGAVPFALAFTMLWWKPPFENVFALAAYYSVAYIIFDAAATFVYMPYFALTPELTHDYDERTALTSYRMFFSILGSLLAFTVPLLIVKSFTPENAPKVLTMGAIFALLSAVPLLLTFLGTRERPEHMQQEQPKLRQSLGSARKNPAFLYAVGIFLLTWIAVDILQSTLLYFVKYILQRESSSDIIMATIFVVGMLALPLWEWVSRRFSKRTAYMAGIAFWAVVQIVLVTVNASIALSLILFLCVLAGIGVSAAHVLPWAIIPDAVEWDEWKTGQRHEGMYYSLVTLIHKVAASIAIPTVLLLLEFTGYQPNSVQQPESAILGLRIIIGPIPALLLLLGIFLAFKYPITREKFAQIRSEIKARRS